MERKPRDAASATQLRARSRGFVARRLLWLYG